MHISFLPGTTDDATELAALHTEVAAHLTAIHGHGPWSTKTSINGALYAMRTSQVILARVGSAMVASFRLTTKKPWAIDTSYFSPCSKPLYLLALAVTPPKQHQGIGSLCLKEAKKIAKAFPSDAIRLDTYDAKAGSGHFYKLCGYTEVGRASYRGVPLIYYELKI